MNCNTSIEHLHQVFYKSLQDHLYMNLDKTTNKLSATPKKDIRLQEVYTYAIAEVSQGIQEIKENVNLKRQIEHLKLLEADGDAYYERYDKETNTWSRWLLKRLARYTPPVLKPYLPKCFFNQMQQAENETKEAYENYKKFVRAKAQEIETLQENRKREVKEKEAKNSPQNLLPNLNISFEGQKDPFDAFEADEELQNALALSLEKEIQNDQPPQGAKQAREDLMKEEKLLEEEAEFQIQENVEEPNNLLHLIDLTLPLSAEEPKRKEKKRDINQVQKMFNYLNNFTEQPLSKRIYLQTLKELIWHIQQLKNISLEEIGISEEIFELFTDENLVKQFQTLLITGNYEALLDILKPARWREDLKQVLAQKGHILFGVQRLAGQVGLQLKNEEGKRIQEREFKDYRGEILLTLADSEALSELEELIKRVESKLVRPCAINIRFKEDHKLTPTLLKHLLTLSQHVLDINFAGLKEINFAELPDCAEQEHQFIKHLNIIHCPDLIKDKFILSPHAKDAWTAAEFSHLLHLFPSFELFKQCFLACSTPQDIFIPEVLKQTTEANFRDFPIGHLSYLLPQFKLLKRIDFSGLQMNDEQLKHWITEGYLAQVEALNLENCQQLTTDSLPSLMRLKHLIELHLPNLPQGTIHVNHLPKLDNPFKIKLFYTTSKVTQKIASDLYTGPNIWASVFQIPLARKGVTEIFTSRQQRLDPQTVAYWLYKNDYQALKEQPAVTTIFADFNAYLTDDNLVDFAKKFPNLRFLSLYGSPRITNQGIIHLLSACPQIKTLDLTDCPKINDKLFFGFGHIQTLGGLSEMIITGTSISPVIVQMMREQNELKSTIVTYKKSRLKISDQDLITDDALENKLAAQDLFRIKYLDFTDCTKLTNHMLSAVLDRLNEPLWIQQDGSRIDNPQRLNLVALNLSGCTQINEEAFYEKQREDLIEEQEKEKINLKILGTLDRVITSGTQLSKILEEFYPKTKFQKEDIPLTLQIDPEAQLHRCLAYDQRAKDILINKHNKEADFKKLAESHINDRLVVELFSADCQDLKVAESIGCQPIDTTSEDFYDMSLLFRPRDEEEPTAFPIHREVLYTQSLFFRKDLRPGGILAKEHGFDCINQHATPEAVQAFVDVLYDKLNIETLDWQTAADVAELIGPKIFAASNAKVDYDKVLHYIHGKFNLENAEEMLFAAMQLEDQKGLKQYENTLLLLLEPCAGNLKEYQEQYRKIQQLSASYPLPLLREKIEEIETAQHAKYREEEERENQALIAALMLEEQNRWP